MKNEIIIRDVKPEDAERLVEIYSYCVLNTAVSFEYKTPSIEEFKERIINTTKKYPYLVCEKNNLVVGYAYAGAYSTREAYSWTATTSIYIDKDYRRKGIGKKLISTIVSDNRFSNLLGLLVTRDAHGLYEQFGFVKDSERAMTRRI